MTKQEQDSYLADGFTQDQVNEIKEGLDSGLDVSVYAKKEFLAIQMHQIRRGLQEELPVESYASADFDWFQMEEIRKGLQGGLDIKLYASPSVSYDRMRQIRKGLKKGINLSNYARLDAGVLRELRKALLSKIYIVEYIQQGYNAEQLEQIRKALEKGLDIVPYLHKELRGVSIQEIRRGLKKGLDVSVYAKLEFSWQQMREIRLGLENRIDISLYANPLYDWQQMKEIRLGLENGIDVSSYRSLMWTSADMRRKRLALQDDVADTEFKGELRSEDFGSCSVSVSGDEMEAYVFVPDGRRVSREDIAEALNKSGIKRGIQKKEIERLFEGKNRGKKILAAKGRPAEPGPDGWYEYFFRTKLNKRPKLLPDGSVDFQSIEWFEFVREGQKIALYHDAEAGTGGYTVTGRELPPKKGREKTILTGRGFMLLDDKKTYVATVSGKIRLEGHRIEIEKALVMEEVSLATGSVSFDGSVYVAGKVGVGALIQATGDVIVNGYVEAASIESGGSILLRQGANGNGVGYVKAAKDISGKFFEACRVYAGGDIRASYSLNCDLHAENRILISGKAGTLAGGTAYARKGMEVQNAGNRAGLATILRLGINDQVSGYLEEIEAKMQEAMKQLDILRNAYAEFHKKYPPEVRNTMDIYLKIESAIFTKEKEVEELTARSRYMEREVHGIRNAEIVVRGMLYEGTSLEINGRYWNAKDIANVCVKRVGERVAVYRN